MMKYCSDYEIAVKDKIRVLQNITNGIGLIFFISGVALFMSWVGIMADPSLLKSLGGSMGTLANILTMGATGAESYVGASIVSFLAIIPAVFAYYALDKQKEYMIDTYNKKVAAKQKKEVQEAEIEYSHRFDSIQKYSICLSLDYESETQLSEQNREKLNKAIYSRIQNVLRSVDYKSVISTSDVLILISNDFSKYDLIYDAIIKTLSEIRQPIERTYNLKIVPSITTDAFSENVALSEIRKQHFEIQSFNFKNRALSTATFAQKYKHLKHNKYAGIPIGEYAYFKKEKTDTYELNVIHKNLTKTITQP